MQKCPWCFLEKESLSKKYNGFCSAKCLHEAIKQGFYEVPVKTTSEENSGDSTE